uniref:Uncharacterized protein n=1 Tax=Romanomermis culicivorax TaxID=13658 RepID=A0A915L3S9_ROMCU
MDKIDNISTKKKRRMRRQLDDSLITGTTKIWTNTATINYSTIITIYDGDLGTDSTKNMGQNNDGELTITKVWGR